MCCIVYIAVREHASLAFTVQLFVVSRGQTAFFRFSLGWRKTQRKTEKAVWPCETKLFVQFLSAGFSLIEELVSQVYCHNELQMSQGYQWCLLSTVYSCYYSLQLHVSQSRVAMQTPFSHRGIIALQYISAMQRENDEALILQVLGRGEANMPA